MEERIEINKITDVLFYLEGLEAVIFDLDDTLYGEKEYVRSGYRAVAKCISQVEMAEKKLWDAFEQGKPAIDEVLKVEGIYTEDIQQRCLNTYRHHVPKIHFYEGVVEMLKQLCNSGLKIGIITDGRPEEQRAKIKALNLDGYVDEIIITDELGGTTYRKPCEAAFKCMQRRLNIEPSKMCYVGDNIKKDFIAPEKLGMRTIWFRNKEGLYN